MRLLILAVLVCVASAKWKVRTPGTFEKYDWNAYKAQYGKQYLTKASDDYRRFLYLDEVMAVNKFNAEYDQGMHTYWKGINQFSDMTQDEIVKAQGLILPADIKERVANSPKKVMQTTAPDAIDWREKGAVQHVKNQGQCGSCWAFATVAALEGRHQIKTGDLVDISEQQFVSCSPEKYVTMGCSGGWYDGAWKYAHDQGTNGIDTQTSYPYTATDTVPCDTQKTSDNKDVAAVCGGPGYTDNTEAGVMESVGNDGPLAVAVNCAWSNYNGGVFEDPNCGPAAAHAVTVVGYDDNEKFWIVKNSWGESWGDKGYIRLRKDYTAIEFGMCGIAQYAYFPLA